MDKNIIISDIEAQIEKIDEALALLTLTKKEATKKEDVTVTAYSGAAFKKLIAVREGLLSTLSTLGHANDRLFAQMIQGKRLTEQYYNATTQPIITCVTKDSASTPVANADNAECFESSDELSK